MASKKQLQLVIEDQQEKITKYEKRLTDLIRAYKGLSKEKEALQIALSAISKDGKSEGKSLPYDGNLLQTSGERSETDEAKHISSLEERVSTLTKSLNAVLEEKNRLEVVGKEDRKRLIDEKKRMEANLQKLEQQCSDTSLMNSLQSQIAELKMQYGQTIKQEQLHSERTEMVCRNLSNTHEERVGLLEDRLQELSITFADKDRASQHYQSTIQALKDKITELNDEKNSVSFNLLNATIDPLPRTNLSAFQSFEKLWNDERSKGDLEVFKNHLLHFSEIHESCHQSYVSLKDEFDLYRLSSGSKSKEPVQSCSCGLQDQVDVQRERLRAHISSAEVMKISHSHQVDSLNQQIVALKQSHKESLDQTILDYRTQISTLEHKISEHCQRSLTTLQQRDEEIHTLTQDLHKMSKEAKAQPSTIAAALLSQVGATASGTVSEGPLLHHLEEMARKQIELNQMSIEKRQLERTLREIQVNSVVKQERMQDKIEDMREELERYKRNMSREGFSHEYLKNVVVQYMTTTDSDARLTMANAISVVLKFSPDETNSVRKFLSQYWWQSRVVEKGRPRFSSVGDDFPKVETTRRLSANKFS